MSRKRAIQNLGELLAPSNATAPVLIVETEGAFKAAKSYLRDTTWVAVWWKGGIPEMDKVDIEPLVQRKLAFWPGADDIGRTNGLLLKRMFPLCKVVIPPDEMPAGWDLESAKKDGWTQEDILGFINSEVIPESTGEPPEAPEHGEEREKADPSTDTLAAPPPPFRCLGYQGDNFFFIPQCSGVIKTLTASELTQSNLTTLAPPNYWRRKYPKDRENLAAGTNWRQASDNLLWGDAGCYAAGIFDPAKIRGVGCWQDGAQIIRHTGETMPFGSGRFIYERAIPLEDDFTAEPLSNEQAQKLLEVCQMLNWKKPISAIHLAGFCAVACLAGALPWRSHIWITGAAGTGKSTAYNCIVEPCVEAWGVYVQGATTEPAIRQLIGRRAMVLMFDEAEGNTPKAQDRMMAVIEYLRACSSTTRAVIAKGGQSGEAQTFVPKAMGCMASIGVTACAAADLSRIEILELSSRSPPPFEPIRKAIDALFGDGTFGARLRARSFQLAPVIIANAATFKKALTTFLSARAGDQLGVLFAGAYSLVKPGLISDDAALEFVQRQDFAERKRSQNDSDEQMFLRLLLDAHVRVTPPDESPHDRTIGELLLHGVKSTDSAELRLARNTLVRYGVKAGDGYFDVSDSHEFLLKRVFHGQRHGAYLRRLIGSEELKCARFGAASHRATRLPELLLLEMTES